MGLVPLSRELVEWTRFHRLPSLRLELNLVPAQNGRRSGYGWNGRGNAKSFKHRRARSTTQPFPRRRRARLEEGGARIAKVVGTKPPQSEDARVRPSGDTWQGAGGETKATGQAGDDTAKDAATRATGPSPRPA